MPSQNKIDNLAKELTIIAKKWDGLLDRKVNTWVSRPHTYRELSKQWLQSKSVDDHPEQRIRADVAWYRNSNFILRWFVWFFNFNQLVWKDQFLAHQECSTAIEKVKIVYEKNSQNSRSDTDDLTKAQLEYHKIFKNQNLPRAWLPRWQHYVRDVLDQLTHLLFSEKNGEYLDMKHRKRENFGKDNRPDKVMLLQLHSQPQPRHVSSSPKRHDQEKKQMTTYLADQETQNLFIKICNFLGRDPRKTTRQDLILGLLGFNDRIFQDPPVSCSHQNFLEWGENRSVLRKLLNTYTEFLELIKQVPLNLSGVNFLPVKNQSLLQRISSLFARFANYRHLEENNSVDQRLAEISYERLARIKRLSTAVVLYDKQKAEAVPVKLPLRARPAVLIEGYHELSKTTSKKVAMLMGFLGMPYVEAVTKQEVQSYWRKGLSRSIHPNDPKFRVNLAGPHLTKERKVDVEESRNWRYSEAKSHYDQLIKLIDQHSQVILMINAGTQAAYENGRKTYQCIFPTFLKAEQDAWRSRDAEFDRLMLSLKSKCKILRGLDSHNHPHLVQETHQFFANYQPKGVPPSDEVYVAFLEKLDHKLDELIRLAPSTAPIHLQTPETKSTPADANKSEVKSAPAKVNELEVKVIPVDPNKIVAQLNMFTANPPNTPAGNNPAAPLVTNPPTPESKPDSELHP